MGVAGAPKYELEDSEFRFTPTSRLKRVIPLDFHAFLQKLTVRLSLVKRHSAG